jgi:ADP-ribose pyrophosphatase
MRNYSSKHEVRWVLNSSTEKYRSPYLRVFDDALTLPGNNQIIFTRIELKDFVAVVPILKRKIVMVEVYRYPANGWSLEVPCGHIDDSELAKKCALRELREETGYLAREIKNLGWYRPQTRSNQKSYIFLAEKLVRDRPNCDETEQIRVRILETKKVYEKLESGKITHAPTIIALYKLGTHRSLSYIA